MYYITEKTSKTGLKFQAISDKRKIAQDEAIAFSKKYGFTQYRSGYWQVFGGISSCLNFKETPDKKIWGKGAGKGEFMPKKNSKVGKLINKELNDLTTVTIDDLNKCIGFDGAPFKTIGFAENNDKYFGFAIGEDWKIEVPKDCEEVLASNYRKIFESKVLS